MRKLLNIDPIIFICTLLLLGIGIFTLYSLTLSSLGSRSLFFQSEFRNQLIFTFIGTILSVIVFLVSPIYFRFKAIIILISILTFAVLVFTYFYGFNVRGVRRWISLGSTVNPDGSITGGLTIQPSEFAKIATILVTSAILSIPLLINDETKFKINRVKLFFIQNRFVLSALIINTVLIMLILAQKSLSVTLVILFIVFSIFFANVKSKLNTLLVIITFLIAVVISQNIFFNLSIVTRFMLLVIVLVAYAISVFSSKISDIAIFISVFAGIIVGFLGVNYTWNSVLLDYQKERINTFVNPDQDIQKEGYQQEQSKISVGAGQVLGHGFRNTSDSRLLLLPEPTTDFIFAIFSFKFGFVGSIMVIFLYLVLITRIFYMSDKMNDRFSSLTLVGVGSMILIQFFSNLGMNLGILPVGGTTLPFMSAGGSSLISMMISIAIVENIIATNKIEKNIYKNKENVLINGWNI